MGKHGYCHLKQSLFDFYAYYRPNILSQCGDLVYKLLGAHVVFRSYLDNYAASKFRKTCFGVPDMFVPFLCEGKFCQDQTDNGN